MPEVLFVGTGDAFGSGGRRNSAILIQDAGRSLLLDCGPTTLGGLKSLGIDPRDLDAVVVSHFHGDHAAGLPFLLLDHRYEHPSSIPVSIVGPPGIEARVRAMCASFSYFTDGDPDSEAAFRTLSTRSALEVGRFRIEAFPAHHHPETSPHMIAVTTGSTRIFFTGDTGWQESLPEQVGRADLLISECVYVEPTFEYHLSHLELERARKRFQCARTILTHLGSEVLADRGRVNFDTAEDGLRTQV